MIPHTAACIPVCLWKLKQNHLDQRVRAGQGVGRGGILGRILTSGAHDANNKVIRGIFKISVSDGH